MNYFELTHKEQNSQQPKRERQRLNGNKKQVKFKRIVFRRRIYRLALPIHTTTTTCRQRTSTCNAQSPVQLIIGGARAGQKRRRKKRFKLFLIFIWVLRSRMCVVWKHVLIFLPFSSSSSFEEEKSPITPWERATGVCVCAVSSTPVEIIWRRRSKKTKSLKLTTWCDAWCSASVSFVLPTH